VVSFSFCRRIDPLNVGAAVQSPLEERLPHYPFRDPVLRPRLPPLTLTEYCPLSMLEIHLFLGQLVKDPNLN